MSTMDFLGVLSDHTPDRRVKKMVGEAVVVMGDLTTGGLIPTGLVSNSGEQELKVPRCHS